MVEQDARAAQGLDVVPALVVLGLQLESADAVGARAFGVARTYRGMQDTVVRSAFLVGGDGIIRGAWRYGVTEVPDVEELLSAAGSLTS